MNVIDRDGIRDATDFQLFQHESVLLKGLNHPFIASFYEVLEDEDRFYMVTEPVEAGDLLGLINRKHNLSEDEARLIFCQFLTVLDYLHSHGICHLDRRPGIVLVNEPMIRNFGCGRSV
jgi:serine/threonine protein kinase